MSVDDLRATLEASREYSESGIVKQVSALLARHDAEAGDDPPDDIGVDLTDSDAGLDRMFQDIVRRSAMIDEIVVTTSFTCTKMRPDGFGGSVMLITDKAIRYRSTADVSRSFGTRQRRNHPLRSLLRLKRRHRRQDRATSATSPATHRASRFPRRIVRLL